MPSTVVKPFSLLAISLATMVALIWGINFIMAKIALEQIPPLTLCAMRFLLASIPGIFFIPKPKAPFHIVMAYGLLTFALQFALVFTGISFGVTPGVASLILQLGVFFSMLFGFIFTYQAINRWQILGALISLSGIAVIAMYRDGSCSLAGFLLILSGAVSWGLGNVVSVKLKSVNMLSLVIWGSLIAFFPLLVASFIFEDPLPILLHPGQLSIAALLSLFYITYLSTHLGYGTWSWLLSRYPMATIAPFALLCPIIALICSSVLLGESLDLWKIVASCLVISGLGINTAGEKLYLTFCQRRTNTKRRSADESLVDEAR